VVGLALNAESMADAEEADLADEPDPEDPELAGPDPADVEDGEAE
jgi:hypothetical protein